MGWLPTYLSNVVLRYLLALLAFISSSARLLVSPTAKLPDRQPISIVQYMPQRRQRLLHSIPLNRLRHQK